MARTRCYDQQACNSAKRAVAAIYSFNRTVWRIHWTTLEHTVLVSLMDMLKGSGHAYKEVPDMFAICDIDDCHAWYTKFVL